MSRRATFLLGAVLAAVLACGAPAPATAQVAAPVIVPTPDSDGIPDGTTQPACIPRTPGNSNWRTCLLPETGAVVDWPADLSGVWPGPRSFILPHPATYALWLGEIRTVAGFPLIWYDVGSGLPQSVPSGPFSFPQAGKYSWKCDSPDNCVGSTFFRLEGTMYVIGPRAIVKPSLVSPDNSGATVTYQLDASGSFVTDYTPHSIVQYAFDFDNDGVFDQTSPEPTAQVSLTPGPHAVRVQVTDDIGRVADYPMFFEIPYVRAGNPEPNPIADNSPAGTVKTGVKFETPKVKLSTVKRIRVAVLRKRGLSVKVSGLTKGDRVRARLLKGKKSVVASGAGTTQSSRKTVRLRVGRSGRRYLKAYPTRLVLDVAVEGTDGYAVTKRVAVRVRYD